MTNEEQVEKLMEQVANIIRDGITDMTFEEMEQAENKLQDNYYKNFKENLFNRAKQILSMEGIYFMASSISQQEDVHGLPLCNQIDYKLIPGAEAIKMLEAEK